MRDELTREEWRLLRSLKRPGDIQSFLDSEIAYNNDPTTPMCRSPRRVMRERTAHCMEGALFAAAALAAQGHPPLLVNLRAVRDDDHVLAVYRQFGHWGAIAKSNYSSLRFREPVYRTLRELVMSYFEHYHNTGGEKTLRAYSRPVNLRRFDSIGWMTAEDDLWVVAAHLRGTTHFRLITQEMARRLRPLDARLRAAERLGAVEEP